jgi:6-phosphogluconolactonase (cycloisomerase 2 family)
MPVTARLLGEEAMRSYALAGRAIVATVLLGLGSVTASAQMMIVGNDEKLTWDDNAKTVIREQGHDTLSIIDMSKPSALRIVATIPLDNSIVGPPTNLAITPKGDIALVANSVNAAPKDNGFGFVPDDRMFVVDLKANPPAIIATLNLGKRPSGMAINPAGTLALVTNRDDGTVSVLSIEGKTVKVIDTITVGVNTDQVSAVAITPDAKRALVAKAAINKIAVLAIDGTKVTYDKQDLPTGIWPYNVQITPNGKIAIIANTGNGGASDGHVDTISVVDLEANPIRVIDHVTVGDSPEGLVMSPKGNLVVTVEARGSTPPKSNWFYHPGGAIGVLRIDDKKVTWVGEVTVGALPEGAVFSADGSYLYVGNFIDSDLSILRVDGDKVTATGDRMKLPGHPASMRGGPQ